MGGSGQRLTPIRSCRRVYVPAGSAPLYLSSLLMSVIPAQVAGVEEIVVCTPTSTSRNHPRPPHTCAASRPFSRSVARKRSPPWATAPRASVKVDKDRGCRQPSSSPWPNNSSMAWVGLGWSCRANGDSGHRRFHRQPGLGRSRSAGASRTRPNGQRNSVHCR